MIQLTDTAVTKVNEILGIQEPKPAGLRISVVGGRLLRVQLFDGFREPVEHAGQNLQFRRPAGVYRSG